jgi:hypothetical protein
VGAPAGDETEGGVVSFDSWCLWHLSEVRRRLRIFMAESDRRQLVKEQAAWTSRRFEAALVLLTRSR